MIVVGFVGFEKKRKVVDIFRHIINKFSQEQITVKKIYLKNLVDNEVDFENYDIIIFESYFFEKELKEEITLTNLSTNSVVIINYDDRKFSEFLRGKIFKLITYGFSNKTCITVSSIQDKEEYLCCVQRNFFNLKGKVIEPQEIRVTLKKYKIKDMYTILELISVILMCGINCISEDKIVL